MTKNNCLECAADLNDDGECPFCERLDAVLKDAPDAHSMNEFTDQVMLND